MSKPTKEEIDRMNKKNADVKAAMEGLSHIDQTVFTVKRMANDVAKVLEEVTAEQEAGEESDNHPSILVCISYANEDGITAAFHGNDRTQAMMLSSIVSRMSSMKRKAFIGRLIEVDERCDEEDGGTGIDEILEMLAADIPEEFRERIRTDIQKQMEQEAEDSTKH